MSGVWIGCPVATCALPELGVLQMLGLPSFKGTAEWPCGSILSGFMPVALRLGVTSHVGPTASWHGAAPTGVPTLVQACTNAWCRPDRRCMALFLGRSKGICGRVMLLSTLQLQ